MAIANAVNLGSNTGEAIKNRYYVTTFLKTATPKLITKQLGQLNVQIGKGQGGYGSLVVYWTKFLNLATVTAGQGEGVPTTATQMTATNVSGTTAQYDAAVSLSDILVYTSFGDMMKIAMERLGENAGKSVDLVVANKLLYSLTAQIAASAAHATAVPSTATLTISELRRAKRTLTRNDAPDIDGFWVAAAHPDAMYDIYADTSTGGWMETNQYMGSGKALFEGEAGKLLGVRFLESSNLPVMNSASITGSGTLYTTHVMGREAFGVTNLQNLETIIHGFGSGGIADPTNKIATAGWKTTFGATVLNSAFGINIQHVVSSTA